MPRSQYQNPLYGKMIEQGYETISDFKRKTKCWVAFETCRRAIGLGEPVSPPILMILMQYLGFSHDEIADHIKNSSKGIEAQDYARVVGQGQSFAIRSPEERLIRRARQLEGKYPQVWQHLEEVVDRTADLLKVKFVDDERHARRGR